MNKSFLAVVLGLAALALADLWVGLRPQLSPASPQAMNAGLAAIEVQMKPGTLVVHSPLFSGAELQALGKLRASPDLPKEHLRASRRILLLDRTDSSMGGFGSPSEIVALPEPLVLKIFEAQESRSGVLYSLLDSFDERSMKVERPPGKVVSQCNQPRNEGGFRCPGQPDWLYVHRRRLKISGQDQECIWAHPTMGGAVVHELPGQPAPASGGALWLELSGGLADDAVRNTSDGATVTTQVIQGGRTLKSLRVPNRLGFQRIRVQIAANQPVKLSTIAPRDGRRHYCLNAEIKDGGK